MSDEKDRIELTEIAKPDEDGELLSASQVRELSEFADDIADAEFIDLETGDSPRLDAEDDDEEPIAAEVVEPSPAVASDVRAAEAPDDPLSKFLAGLPKNTDITVVAKRKSDHGLVFRIPNTAPQKFVCNVYWDGRTAEQIYEYIQTKHGGGRYWLQLQYGGGLKESWEVTIDDPSEPSDAEKVMRNLMAKENEAVRVLDPSPAFAEKPQPPKSALEELKERLTEAKEFRELLGGDQQPVPAVQEPLSVQDQIVLKVADNILTSDPNLGVSVLQKAFKITDSSERTMGGVMTDVVHDYLTHPDKIVNAVTAVAQIIGMVAPAFGRSPTPPKTVIVPPGAMVAAPQQQPSGIVMPPPVASPEAPQPEIAVTQPGESPMQQTPPVAPQADEFSGARW